MKKEALILSILFSCSARADVLELISELKTENSPESIEASIVRYQGQIISNYGMPNSISLEDVYGFATRIDLNRDSTPVLDLDGEELFDQLFSEEFINTLESESATETEGRPCGVIKP